MCVLQDFEAITPNLLARTVETVEGGGIIVLLLKTMSSLKQLYSMAMVGSPFVNVFTFLTTLTRMFTRGIEPPLMILSLQGSTSALFSLWAPATTVWYWTTS
jgi:tRNA(Met) C34 N-acetyltransferase TmcA